ncbi:MAG: hypothetical protein Q9215_006514 [Flavoplaca cf. flavocitrina]
MATLLRMKGANGYAGVPSSIADAIYFINDLEVVDTDTIDEKGTVCAICQGCLSDPEADRTWHQIVRLLRVVTCLGDDHDQMSQGENAEAENIQDSQTLSMMRDLDVTTDDIPDIRTTTFAVDDPDSCNDSSDKIEEGSSDDGEADGQQDSEEVREDENGNNSGHEAMQEGSPDTDDDNIGFQYDSNADSGDESSSDSGDVIMGEANHGTCNDGFGTAAMLGRYQIEYQSRRSNWLPGKAVQINKTMSWMHFLVQSPTSDYTIGESQTITWNSYSLAYHSGDTNTGLESLQAGNNNCPCCRDEVYARPSLDSLMSLATRIRVWDTAYAFLGIPRNDKEDFLREQCLKFIETCLVQRISQGEGINGGKGRQVFQALRGARWSLIKTKISPYQHSVCRSEEDRDNCMLSVKQCGSG